MVSLLNISTSDNEEAHKAVAHETACNSNIQYGIWWDEQIRQRNEGIAQRDKQVNDYANAGRPSKAPDKIGPPLSYMEDCRVFKPLDTMANPLGLCRFYQTNPQKSNIVTGPKSAASAHRIKHLLELAKELVWPLTIVVFKGGMVTLLGLLQELHTDPHSGGGEDGAEKQGVLLPHLHVRHKEQLHVPQSHHHLPLLEVFLWKMPQVHSIIWAADDKALSKVSQP